MAVLVGTWATGSGRVAVALGARVGVEVADAVGGSVGGTGVEVGVGVGVGVGVAVPASAVACSPGSTKRLASAPGFEPHALRSSATTANALKTALHRMPGLYRIGSLCACLARQPHTVL